ncbi:MAG: urate oxidase [Thermomicrobiales bacterium]|nr:urate oxidase [Thermomicrobiales bacterium]
MQYEITYGKRRVPVYRVRAAPLTGVGTIPESPFVGRGNELIAAEIDVEVYGDDFLPAYTEGDNSMVVATDSMKNFIIRESLAYDGATLEGLCHFLGAGLAATYPQRRSLRVSARELPFAPVPVRDGGGGWVSSNNLFAAEAGDHAWCSLRMERDADGSATIVDHDCARRDMHLMKLAGSSFTAFVRDGYTTLPDRRDRPLFIYMDAHWRYIDPRDALGENPAAYVAPEQIRDACQTVFAEFVSESIQHLLHEMGTCLLGRFPGLAEVRFAAQNRTRDPFGERADGARVYSDPFPAFGHITLAMRRGER